MVKIIRIIPWLTLLALLGGPLVAASAQEEAGSDKAESPGPLTVEGALSPEKRIEELKARLKWASYQKKQYEKYIGQQERVLDGLERQRREMEGLEMDLTPLLIRTVERLAKVVAGDMDFLTGERAKRIRFLQASLTDYRVGLNERLRRILEALRVEAGYGRDVEKTETEIMLEGENIRVNLLRLGRIALFYQTPDNRYFGWRLSGDRDWRIISGSGVREIKKAFDIASKRQVAELVRLPLGPEQP